MKEKILIRIANTCIAAALLGVAIAWSAEGSVPPPGTAAAPHTLCEEYLATPAFERLEQWRNSFKDGLSRNPNLNQYAGCILDLPKMLKTDDFMMRECRDTKANFDELAFKALSRHLALCGIVITN